MSAAGQLVDEVLRRVRDPQGTANPRATVLDLLDRCQVLFVRATTTLIHEYSVAITPTRLVYDINPLEQLRILDIFYEDRRLWPVRWSQLQNQLGPLWWRQNGASGPTTWAPLGTTHFIIYPALPLLTSNTITLRTQRRPALVNADEVEMELPSEFFPQLLDFLEAVILLRQRDPALADALERISGPAAEPATMEVA